MPTVGSEFPADSVPGEGVNDPYTEHIQTQIDEFRKQLLGMTLRNHFLNCPHNSRTQDQLRVIDELPDEVFQRLEGGGEFKFLPLPTPRDQPDDEDSSEFIKALEKYKQKSTIYALASEAVKNISAQRDKEETAQKIDRDARDYVRLHLRMGEWKSEHGLSDEDLCRTRGIDPSYELPSSTQDGIAARHHDAALQTRLRDDLLSARLAHLRNRARSSISQTGVATLFAAFGFLEWFESDNSNQAHLAPLILVPAELDRKLAHGKYLYTLRGTEEAANANVTLDVYLRGNFDLQLPMLDQNDSPESYWEKVRNQICSHHHRWRVHRFLTIGLFAYSKLAIYQDLGQHDWLPSHDLVAHNNIRTLLAQSGVSDTPYAENRKIDVDEWTAQAPILIYDADSSQHSAIADVLSGKNLTIFGPPGTGKSQTIANTIASATMAGKTVLFVAEKLTALEVVRDRLDKAGLGPFCFNLHAHGLKSSAVRQSLAERASMPRPNFDPALYQRQKADWAQQRDALKIYAGVMGTKVGKLDETVHDVLWRTIDRMPSATELPRAVSEAQLAKVKEVSPTDVDGARSCIDQLVRAEAKFSELVEAEGRLPWRGAMLTQLPPSRSSQRSKRL